MEQARQHQDVSERVASLALEATLASRSATPSGAEGEPQTRTMLVIRAYARELLDGGYPRDELYADFERAVETVRQRSSDDEAEDPILDVMDFLVGWCSPGAKL